MSDYSSALIPTNGFVIPPQPFPTAVGPAVAFQAEPRDNATPYVMEYSTGLEYQAASNLVLKATYLGQLRSQNSDQSERQSGAAGIRASGDCTAAEPPPQAERFRHYL